MSSLAILIIFYVQVYPSTYLWKNQEARGLTLLQTPANKIANTQKTFDIYGFK
jgi:hypothetical protein